MYRVYLTSIRASLTRIPDRGLVAECATIDEAKAAGQRTGFEFYVMHKGHIVGSWRTFSGWREFT